MVATIGVTEAIVPVAALVDYHFDAQALSPTALEASVIGGAHRRQSTSAHEARVRQEAAM